ncbi:JmjC domain-containing protein [Stagonosporopsis vannaccii]|nr:JmjC domain-containing protein [Stagonosporopsis vannaccii]
MPAARPRASFEPIPPDFDVRTFVETVENFHYVDRISYEMIASNGMEQFEKLILLHVIIGGKPLVIDGFEEVLDPWTFTPSWLRDNHGEKVETARNLTTKENIPLTIKHYLKHLSKLTDQFFDDPDRYRDKTRQRIYLKDIDCPQVWQDKLKDHIPSSLFYLNDSTGEVDGAGALEDFTGRKGRGIGRAGDLMSSLPPEMRAENLMCYIGHEGTYTPSHREMCASLGQNIMVDASKQISEDGKPEQPGSALWFMTETKERHLVSEYWLSVLGHDIEVENHFAQLIAWKKAPFKTYVVEQRPGDFILIPPLAPHQVWNRGTRTMKIAWNRTTVETLELALAEALPNSRIVCRDEQYKNKAIVYYTLQKYSQHIRTARALAEAGGEQAEAVQHSLKVRQVQRDFKRLFDLYKSIMLSEMFDPSPREQCEFLPFDSNVTCSYCRCNIFNRFLSCKTCKNLFSSDIDEPYDVCMECYCMGRSCGCQSGYQWTEQWRWKDLVHKYEEWRAQIIDIDGKMTEKTPLPLQEERRYLGKKTLAQVCQEQLKIRPFVDIKAPQVEDNSEDEEVEVDAYGVAKQVKNKRSKQWLRNHKSCHTCLHRHPNWKVAFCSNCDLGFCYGTLFRAHDMMPLSVMEQYSWKCPHCRRVCNTGYCRRDPRQHPYEPKGTLLGHDTKKVADPRSIECLVDFSVSNLNWMREEEGMGHSAMQRRMQQAERDRMADPSLDPRYMDEDPSYSRNSIVYSPVEDNDGFVDIDTIQTGNANGYEPDHDPNGDIPRLAQKRGREDEDNGGRKRKKTKKVKKKKDEDQPLEPKNVSGKQYQREMQRRLLDEAKREDRFIIVAANMKNKSRIVKLYLDPQILENISNRPTPERPQVAARNQTPESEAEGGNIGHILQSDVMPKATSARTIDEKEKATKVFRCRVEPDESYTTRKRNVDTGGNAKPPGRPRGSRRYEEITLESDEELCDDGEDVSGGAHPGRFRGRTSNWLARKNQDEDENMPTELPSDFRDGDVRPRERERARERAERRRSMPAKHSPATIPRGQSPKARRKSTVDMNAEPENDNEGTGPGVDDVRPSETIALAQHAAAIALEEEAARLKAEERAAAAEREAQENLRAKMALFHSDDEEPVDDFFNNLTAEEPLSHEPDLAALAEPVRTGPPQATNSLFDRPEMNGKRIKVVSSASKRNSENSTTTSTTIITAPILTFTSVNKRPQAIDVSDLDSDDEIPACAPPSRQPSGRARLVPTRGGIRVSIGGGMPKRGRGRPRKEMSQSG